MRRLWLLLLPVLALLALGSGARAQGIKIGPVNISDGNPGSFANPVHPGGTAVFQYKMTRNNHVGATGNFVATLTYNGFTPANPGITFDAAAPTSINLLQKVATGSFFFSVHVGANVAPGVYHFSVLAYRTGKDQGTATGTLVVGFTAHGATAVDDGPFFTTGPAVTVPVLANDIKDPNLPAAPFQITAVQGLPIATGGTVSTLNYDVTLNANQTLTFTPSGSLLAGSDSIQYTITQDGVYFSSANVNINFGQFPGVSVSPSSTRLCAPANTILTATASNGFTPYVYEWRDSSNKVVQTSLATTGSDTYVASPGSYSVKVTDFSGQVSDAASANIIVDGNGVTLSGQGPNLMVECPMVPPDFTKPTCSDPTVAVRYSDVTTTPCPGTYSTTRTWTAQGPCGGPATVSQTIAVVDTTPPTITSFPGGGSLGNNPASLPSDTSIAAGVVASDTCGMAHAVVTHVDGGTPCAMTRTFTIKAVDDCGNMSAAKTAVFTWRVDTTGPVITVPGNVTVASPAGICSAVVTFSVSATDNCDGTVSAVASPPSGSTFPVGSTTVTVTATDSAGNTSTSMFMVTVTPTAPTAPTLAKSSKVIGGNPVAVVTGSFQGNNIISAASWTISGDKGGPDPFSEFAHDFAATPGTSELDIPLSVFQTYATPVVTLKHGSVTYDQYVWTVYVNLKVTACTGSTTSATIPVTYTILIDPSGHGKASVK